MHYSSMILCLSSLVNFSIFITKRKYTSSCKTKRKAFYAPSVLFSSGKVPERVRKKLFIAAEHTAQTAQSAAEFIKIDLG
ncbi:MAG TPA: hypothetical protein DEO95_08590, partial [Ruminococcaceae bacterium]|nr:hypothetical protein [Oscillospiraceae bacterium]